MSSRTLTNYIFNASKPSWVFSTLFGRDVVQDWFYPVETPPKNAVKERSWELPKINVDDFMEIFINSPLHPHDESIFKEFELVLDYLVHGILERPGKLSKSNIPPISDYVEKHTESARFNRTIPLFVSGYSGRDSRTGSLLFGVNKEDPLFKSRLLMESRRKPFKSCTPPGEEYIAKHPECGDISRVIPADRDNHLGKERVSSSLLDCFKELHQHGRRRVDDKHVSNDEFENLLGRIRYLYDQSLSSANKKEQKDNVKQDKPKEKSAYGIRFYIAHPYQDK